VRYLNNVNKKFFFSILIFSFLILLYQIYKSEYYYLGEKRKYFINIFIFLIILKIYIFFILFSGKKISSYLTIFFFSSIFSLYLFEGFLIYKYDGFLLEKKKKLFKERTGNNYDTRTKFEVFNHLKKKSSIVVSIAPSYRLEYMNLDNELFPLSGISSSETLHCNENGYFSIYKSDRFGFNNPNDEWDKNNIQYLLLGDSFVQGNCVNRPYDLGSILRSLSDEPVLNLGYSGNGPLFYLATLKEYFKLNTKNVIWFHSENDLYNLERDLGSKTLKKYLEDNIFNQNLRNRQNEIDKFLLSILNYIEETEGKKQLEEQREKDSKIYKIYKFITIKNLRELFLKKFFYVEEKKKDFFLEFKNILELAKNFTIENKSNFYFVFLPSYERYIKMYDNYEIEYLEVLKIVGELNISLIDLHKEFKKEKDPTKYFPFGLSGHYNEDGYQKVGKIVFNEIKK